MTSKLWLGLIVALVLGSGACGGDAGKTGEAGGVTSWLYPCDPVNSGAWTSCQLECLALPLVEWPDDSKSSGNYCTAKCETDADCGDLGTDAVCSKSGLCTLSCDSPSWDGYAGNRARVCLNGEPTLCDDVQGQHCTACGCALGAYCDPSSDECIAKTVGDPCTSGAECPFGECAASHTDSDRMVCQSRLGEVCTAASCALCMSEGRKSYCSGSCDEVDGVYVAESGNVVLVCLFNPITGHSTYYAQCVDTACPFPSQLCSETSTSQRYCDVPPVMGASGPPSLMPL